MILAQVLFGGHGILRWPPTARWRMTRCILDPIQTGSAWPGHFRDSFHSKEAEIKLWPGLALVVQALKAVEIVLIYKRANASIKRFAGWLDTKMEWKSA